MAGHRQKARKPCQKEENDVSVTKAIRQLFNIACSLEGLVFDPMFVSTYGQNADHRIDPSEPLRLLRIGYLFVRLTYFSGALVPVCTKRGVMRPERTTSLVGGKYPESRYISSGMAIFILR